MSNNSFRPLTDRTRDLILWDLVDSMIENSRQTDSFRASETARIAKRRRVTNLQVAAVRANMTRGAYGSVNSLKNQRRRELKA